MKLSIRAMAKELGISKSQVQRDVKDGMPLDSVEAAKAWRYEHRDPTFAPNLFENEAIGAAPEDDLPTDDDTSEYRQARTAREKLRIEKETLELEKLKGLVISVEDASRIAFSVFRMIRDDVLNVPARVKDQLHACQSAFDVEMMLEDELSAVFSRYDENSLLVEEDDDDEDDDA